MIQLYCAIVGYDSNHWCTKEIPLDQYQVELQKRIRHWDNERLICIQQAGDEKLRESQEKVELLQRQVEDGQQREKNLHMKIEQAKQQGRERERESKQQGQQLQQAREREKGLEKQLDDLQGLLQQAQQQKEESKMEIQQGFQRERQGKEREQHLQQQLQEKKRELEQYRQEKEKEVQLGRKSVQNLQQQLQRKERESEQYRQEKETQLQQREINLQLQLEQTRKKEKDLQRQVEDGKEKEKDLQRQVEDGKEKEKDLQRQVEGGKEKEKDLQRQVEDGKEKEKDLQRQVEGGKGKEKDLQRQVEGAKKKEQDLQMQIEESKQQGEKREQDLQQQLQETRKSKQELDEKVKQLEEQILIAKSSWEVNENEITVTKELLGKGGYGEVKVADFRGLKVAAKCLYGVIISPYNIEKFSQEMNIASKIRHPNLVQFIGATTEGILIILTEIMQTSLRKEIETEELSYPAIQSISSDVACALNYLHLFKPHPILHRDVSSANVLLQQMMGSGWRAKVSDYGTVKLQHLVATQNPGNPVYSAPESPYPRQHSSAMDVFSYGVLLIEMNVRQFPDIDKREAHIKAIKWPLFENLVQRCLTENYKQRPAMSDIIKELNESI